MQALSQLSYGPVMHEHDLEKTKDEEKGVAWACRRCGLRVLFPRRWPPIEGDTYSVDGCIVSSQERGADLGRARTLAGRVSCDNELVRYVQTS